MRSNTPFLAWDLHEIVSAITGHHPEIIKMYLFGSRAYKTNSFRSDIDILAITDSIPISDVEVNSWLHEEYPPVDLFCSYDSQVARSVINGSCIHYRKDNDRGYCNLSDQLDARLLWDKRNGFSSDFSDWIQQTLNGIDYKMSIIPSYPIPDFSKTVDEALQSLEASGIKTYFAGSTRIEISESIIRLIEIGLKKPVKFQNKANKFSYDQLKIENEYDFQNFIQFILRPVFPDITPEPFMITIDGNKKYADFAVSSGRIVIEAKWLDTPNKKNSILKTIRGLSDFYTQNPNTTSLIFLVLYKKEVSLDKYALEQEFSFEKSTPPIFVRFMESDYV